MEGVGAALSNLRGFYPRFVLAFLTSGFGVWCRVVVPHPRPLNSLGFVCFKRVGGKQNKTFSVVCRGENPLCF